MSIVVSLKFPTFKGAQTLERAPKFLRFTLKGTYPKITWDALDQLTDEADPSEQILAGEIINRGRIHVDRVVKKKKVGEWFDTADYRVIDDGPGEDVLRDSSMWQAWCLERVGK